MIPNPNYIPNTHASYGDKIVCLCVILIIGIGFTTLYFTIGDGSK